MTVNKVCLSSLNALHLADLMIAAGEAEVVVVGGMESMSKAPYLLDGARAGIGYGDAALRDEIVADGLTLRVRPADNGMPPPSAMPPRRTLAARNRMPSPSVHTTGRRAAISPGASAKRSSR